jgi:hypothetical protein
MKPLSVVQWATLLLAASVAWAGEPGAGERLGENCVPLDNRWVTPGSGFPVLEYPSAAPEEVTARVNCSLLGASQQWKSTSRSMTADRLELRDAAHRLAILQARAHNLEAVRADTLQALTEQQRFADTFFRPTLAVAVASTMVYGPERTQDELREELARRNREAIRQHLLKLRAKPVSTSGSPQEPMGDGVLEIEPVPSMQLEVFRARQAALLEVLMLRSPEPLRTSAESVRLGDTMILGESARALERDGFAPLLRIHGEEIQRLVDRVRELNVFHESSYEQFLNDIRGTMGALRRKLADIENEYSEVSAELNQLTAAIGGQDAETRLLRSLENVGWALTEHHRQAPRMVVEATSNVWQAETQAEFSRQVVDRTLRRALDRLNAAAPVYQAFAWVKEAQGQVRLTVLVVAGANVDQGPGSTPTMTMGTRIDSAPWPAPDRR